MKRKTNPPSCSTCVHFEQASPYRWGLCKHPLPWWVDSDSPTVHPYENNAKDCDCYMPNAPLERTAVAGTLDGVVGNSGGDE